MRSAIINGSSPKEDIWSVLTGVWNEYNDGAGDSFHIVKTPFFIAITATLKQGSHILPVTPKSTAMLRWACEGDSGNIVLKAKNPNFTLPKNAFVEVNLYGTEGNS